MTLIDPNMRCTCGHRRFRETVARGQQPIQRWVEFDADAVLDNPGFGSTPIGLDFGGGAPGQFGLFDGFQRFTERRLACENCGRARSVKRSGGYALWGSYVRDNKAYLVVSDLSGVDCLSLRFTSTDFTQVYTAPLIVSADPPLPLGLPAPSTVAPAPPPGAVVANTVLEALLPDVEDYSEFRVDLVDRCANQVYPLFTLPLENTMPTIHILNADLGGAPIEWVRDGVPFDLVGVTQVPGLVPSIPFDKVDGVVEYDARLGSLPDAQGWTRGGAGSGSEWALDNGGVLRANLTNTNYYTVTLDTATAPKQIWAYATAFLRDVTAVGTASGFHFDARIAPGSGGSWDGCKLVHRSDTWYTALIDDTAELPFTTSGDYPEGWFALHMGRTRLLTPNRGWAGMTGVDGGRPFIFDPVSTWGGLVGGPSNPGIFARFGMSAGTSTDGWIRNFVVSANGRFIRPMFRSTAPSGDAVLRLYLSADAEAAAPQTLARFVVKYGSYASGTSPFTRPTTSVAQTITFTTKNQIVESSFALTGLSPRAPLWFTIERDWSHVDDRIKSTIRLYDATLRVT